MTVIQLIPPPVQVADLLVEMTRLDWPTTEPNATATSTS
jgi:hypothetical protein